MRKLKNDSFLELLTGKRLRGKAQPTPRAGLPGVNAVNDARQADELGAETLASGRGPSDRRGVMHLGE